MAQNRLFYITVAIILLGFIYIVMPKNTTNSEQVASSELSNKESYAKGDSNAPVKLIQYSDFLCPSCSQVSLGVFPIIEEKYVDTGQVYFEFRPLAFIASGSQTAAEGAFCAANQNKFWGYHDVAYQAVWTEYFSKGVDPTAVPLYSIEGVKALAKISGVNEETFNKCMDDRSKQKEKIAFTKESQEKGITGTPYFIVNNTPINGVPTYEILDAAIKSKL